MSQIKTSFLFFYSILWSFAFEAIDGNEGEKCETSNLPGICTQLRDCALALNAIRRGKPHNLRRCGFDSFEEVVCCPKTSSRNPSVGVSSTTEENIVWSVRESSTRTTTTTDSNIIWNDNNEVDKSTEDVDNKQRINAKRKCEKACQKMIKDYNIKPDVQYNILGGEDAKVGDFPHMAGLGFITEDESKLDWQLCAASLISSRFLITAAHCFINQIAPNLKTVRLGVVQLNSTFPRPQDYAVQTTMVHPKYNTRSRHNDIALIELERDVKMTKNVKPACLYSEDTDPTGLLVTGWGDILRGTGFQAAGTLQVAALNPVPVDRCNNTLWSKSAQRFSSRTIVNSQICAMSSTSDSCQGDSGGPLQVLRIDGAYSIVGIVSYGSGCGGDTPGVYTRVSRFLLWIEEYVWPD